MCHSEGLVVCVATVKLHPGALAFVFGGTVQISQTQMEAWKQASPEQTVNQPQHPSSLALATSAVVHLIRGKTDLQLQLAHVQTERRMLDIQLILC